MPRIRSGTNGLPEPGLPDAFRRIAVSSAQWAEAEYALARTETGIMVRRIAAGIGVAIAAMVVLLVSLVILAQAAVTALAHVLSGPAYAGLAVGIGLLFCVILLAFVARNLLSARHAQPSSLLLRWVTGANSYSEKTR